MKRWLSPLLAALLLLTSDGAVAQGDEPSLRIRLTAGETVLYATLEDNSASRDLLSRLPLSLDWQDYNATEKIAYPEAPLELSDALDNCDPDVGTLAYYAPWGNLCLFYRDFRHSEGLVPLGHIEGDVEALTAFEDGFVMLMERANEPASAS